jgi:hypothetical protein
MELWNGGKLAVADEIFTADYANHDPAATVEKVLGLYKETYYDLNNPALPRKAAGRARDGVELHLGPESAARSRPGGQAAQAGAAPAEAATTADAWDAAAH